MFPVAETIQSASKHVQNIRVLQDPQVVWSSLDAGFRFRQLDIEYTLLPERTPREVVRCFTQGAMGMCD
jgi:hypothetical protein